jgi:hypothetical protein
MLGCHESARPSWPSFTDVETYQIHHCLIERVEFRIRILIDVFQQQHRIRIEIPSNLLSNLMLPTNTLARPSATVLDQIHLAHQANHAAAEGHHARHGRHDTGEEFRLVGLDELGFEEVDGGYAELERGVGEMADEAG